MGETRTKPNADQPSGVDRLTPYIRSLVAVAGVGVWAGIVWGWAAVALVVGAAALTAEIFSAYVSLRGDR